MARSLIHPNPENGDEANREFWTVKISEAYEVECCYQTVARFFHQQAYALKIPQPFPDRQDEEKRRELIEFGDCQKRTSESGSMIKNDSHQSLFFFEYSNKSIDF